MEDYGEEYYTKKSSYLILMRNKRLLEGWARREEKVREGEKGGRGRK